MSKMLYLLPLYGGCAEYLISALQTKQTEALRQIASRRWVIPGKRYVSKDELLKQCGWLCFRQLSFYTTVVNVHKKVSQRNSRKHL